MQRQRPGPLSSTTGLGTGAFTTTAQPQSLVGNVRPAPRYYRLKPPKIISTNKFAEVFEAQNGSLRKVLSLCFLDHLESYLQS